MYTALENLDHDEGLAKALGNLVVVWANAENVLCQTLAGVLDAKITLVLFGYYRIPSFEARVKFIRSMIPEWETENYDKAAIDKAVERLSDLSLTRNNWIHHVWCTNKDKSETVLFDYRREAEKGRRRPVKSHDVWDHIKTVRARTTDLEGFIPPVKL